MPVLSSLFVFFSLTCTCGGVKPLLAGFVLLLNFLPSGWLRDYPASRISVLDLCPTVNSTCSLFLCGIARTDPYCRLGISFQIGPVGFQGSPLSWPRDRYSTLFLFAEFPFSLRPYRLSSNFYGRALAFSPSPWIFGPFILFVLLRSPGLSSEQAWTV